MLRTMMKDAEGAKPPNRGKVDEPFVRALRKLRERYEGKAVSTRELLDVFAEEIPLSLRYEGKKSLDWFLNGNWRRCAITTASRSQKKHRESAILTMH